MANWGTFRGTRELTYAGLEHALRRVNRNAFVCVWTDAIGDDTNNGTLKDIIIDLKATTLSEIFIMAITGTNEPAGAGTTRQAGGTDDTSNTDRSAISSQDGGEDVRDRKARATMVEFNRVFGGIGHVIDVMGKPDFQVISEVIELMKASALCNLKKNTTTTSTKSPTTI